MVVPFDKNYEAKSDSRINILKNKTLPTDSKILLYNDLLARKIIKSDKQLPVESEKEKKIDNLMEDERYQKLYEKLLNDLLTKSDFKSQNLNKNVSNQMEIDDNLEFENLNEDEITKLRKNKPARNLFGKNSNKIAMSKPSSEKRNLNNSINSSFNEPKSQKLKKLEEYYNEEIEYPAKNTRYKKNQDKLNSALIDEWEEYK